MSDETICSTSVRWRPARAWLLRRCATTSTRGSSPASTARACVGSSGRDVLTTLAVVALCRRAGFSLGGDQGSCSPPEVDRSGRRSPPASATSCGRRRHISSTMADQLDHALRCPSPNVFDCEHFRAALDERARRCGRTSDVLGGSGCVADPTARDQRASAGPLPVAVLLQRLPRKAVACLLRVGLRRAGHRRRVRRDQLERLADVARDRGRALGDPGFDRAGRRRLYSGRAGGGAPSVIGRRAVVHAMAICQTVARGERGEKPRKTKRHLSKVPKYEEPNTFPRRA